MAVSVLIVDDEAGVRDMLSDYLSEQGFEAHQATNGKEALDMVVSAGAQVVLLDMRMPVMDGWEFLETLRRYSDLPVIALTAETDDSDRARTFELGVNDYIHKPFKLSDVGRRIEAILSERD